MKTETKFKVFDSELDEVYPTQTRYAMVYEPLWQTMRFNCRGCWTELSFARAASAQLEVYLIRSPDAYNKQVRVWRVLGMLVGIPLNSTTALGIRTTPYEVADFIEGYTNKIRVLHTVLGMPQEWDWATSRRGLYALYRRKPQYMEHLLRPIRERMTSRPGALRVELQHYLLMAQQVKEQVEQENERNGQI